MARVQSWEPSSEHRVVPRVHRQQREVGGDKARAELTRASVRVKRNAARPEYLNLLPDADGESLAARHTTN
jgi:hypothetical protein